MKVALVGAGASGLFCAGRLAEKGALVHLFEANEKVGKKLFITGKGRCNVTNASTPNEVLENVVSNPKFLYGALFSFTSTDLIDFFENNGTPIKIERGNRAFPVSDKSSDIIKTLERYCLRNGVKIELNHKVEEIIKQDDMFKIKTVNGTFDGYDAVVVCTGGKTYSATGSTGDGYRFAKCFGHCVTQITPALVPILLKDEYVKDIEGLSLKNVKLVATSNGKVFKELFGEMLFTKNGLSGPIALSMSSYINKKSDIELYIDFKPALSEDQLFARIERDVLNIKESQVSTLIAGLLPKALVSVFLKKCKILPILKNKSLTKGQIQLIVASLKKFDVCYAGLDKLDFGIITSGGVDVKEINPKTMESKIVNGLFFIGEVLDVDALTGGYNLQIAFSTAYIASNSIMEKKYGNYS